MSASLSTGTRRTLWIAGALAVVIAVVAGAFGWTYLRDRSHRLTITAQFESVSGLYPDNKVSVLGMPIGKVTKITSRGTYMEVAYAPHRTAALGGAQLNPSQLGSARPTPPAASQRV
ncbi:MlaD family protein [Mycobacteroides abscessus]|uniref:MlaD family protein n=1 Tax=Mycobacteroides abscessus TaxID=36809 RepID=UPI001F1CDDB3|nr:MlaD family protein [Mycobacteroides abscessus]